VTDPGAGGAPTGHPPPPDDEPSPVPAAAPSFSERYAGTPWGRPIAAPQAAEATAAAAGGFSCLRVLVILVGIFWLLPALIGIVTALGVGSAGEVYGVALSGALRTVLLIGVLINLLWVAFGLKLILAPGRTSLGCSALLGLGYALIFAAALGVVIESPAVEPALTVVLAILLALYLLVMMVSLLGRTSWD